MTLVKELYARGDLIETTGDIETATLLRNAALMLEDQQDEIDRLKVKLERANDPTWARYTATR